MPNILDTVQISGSSYDLKDKNAPSVSAVTQQEYDNLPSSAKTSNTFFVITDALGVNVTSAVTSGSTDVVTSGGVYDALNGLKLVKITAEDYALITPDANTVYFIGDSNGYIMKLGSVSIS